MSSPAIPVAQHGAAVKAFVGNDQAVMQSLGVETGGETFEAMVRATVGEANVPTPAALNKIVDSVMGRIGLHGVNAAIATEVANAAMNLFPHLDVAKKATVQNYLANILQGAGAGYIDRAHWRGRHAEAEQIANVETATGTKIDGKDVVLLLPVTPGVSRREYHLPRVDATGAVVVVDGRLQTKCPCGAHGFAMHSAAHKATVTTSTRKGNQGGGQQNKTETKVPAYVVEDVKLEEVRFQPGYAPCEQCFPRGEMNVAPPAKEKSWLEKVGKDDTERAAAFALRLAFIKTAEGIHGHIAKEKAQDYGREIEKIPADQYKALVKIITVKPDGTIEHKDLDTIIGLIRQHGGNLELHNKALAGVDGAGHVFHAALEAIPAGAKWVGLGILALVVCSLIGWMISIYFGAAVALTIFGALVVVPLVATIKPIQALTTPIAKALGGGDHDWLFGWVRSVWWFVGITTLVEVELIHLGAPEFLRYLIPGFFAVVGGSAKAVLGGTFEGREILAKMDRNQAVIALALIGVFICTIVVQWSLAGDEFVVKEEVWQVPVAVDQGQPTVQQAPELVHFVRTPSGVFFAEDVVWNRGDRMETATVNGTELKLLDSDPVVVQEGESLNMPHYTVTCAAADGSTDSTCTAHRDAWIATPFDGLREGAATLYDSPEEAFRSRQFVERLSAKRLKIADALIGKVEDDMDALASDIVTGGPSTGSTPTPPPTATRSVVNVEPPAERSSPPATSNNGSFAPVGKDALCKSGVSDALKRTKGCPGY